MEFNTNFILGVVIAGSFALGMFGYIAFRYWLINQF